MRSGCGERKWIEVRLLFLEIEHLDAANSIFLFPEQILQTEIVIRCSFAP